MVTQIVNENMNSGMHTVNFNASNLPSGIYIYTLQTDKQTLTKKMTLLK
jgi:hypothetical protein